MSEPGARIRVATRDDALTLCALAIEVFLDTYARDGIRPDLAREAFAGGSAERMAARLADAQRFFLVAERGAGVVGFAEISRAAGEDDPRGPELVRLYVQPAAQGARLGAKLLAEAERICATEGADLLWLTAWAGNHRALGFYASQGYRDFGPRAYRFEDQVYENRLLVKHLGPRRQRGAEAR